MTLKFMFFSIPYHYLLVRLFKRPDKDRITSEDTEVNIRSRWQSLEKRLVASGFCPGMSCCKASVDLICYIMLTLLKDFFSPKEPQLPILIPVLLHTPPLHHGWVKV